MVSALHERQKMIEKVQHRFTRLIPGIRQLSYEERLRRLRLWTLEERRNRADILEVFKMKAGLSDIPLCTFFKLTSDSRTRGHSWKIVKRRSSLDIRKYFFSERLVHRWNSLSQEDVDQTTLNGFRKALEKKRMIRTDFYGLSPPSLKWLHHVWTNHSDIGVTTPGKLPGKLYR